MQWGVPMPAPVRLILPPNLPAAALRDAIAIRLELDLSTPPAAPFMAGLAALQRLGVAPQPVSFLQLSRAQLRELVAAFAQEKVFFRADRPKDPLAWNGLDLPGVSEHLVEKPLPPPPPPPPKPAPKKAADPSVSKVLARMKIDGSPNFLAITLPSTESELYEPALELVRSNRFILDPLSGKWWLRDRHKVLNLLASHGTEFRARYEAEFTGNFLKNTAGLKFADVTVAVREQGDAYDVSLGLQAGSADENQVRSALAAGRGYVENNGAIFLIDRARIARLESAHRALAQDPNAAGAGGRHRVAKARAAEVSALLEELSPGYAAPDTWRRRIAALRNLSTLERAPIPGWFTARLRPYQEIGAAWLWHLCRQELGGILADEMGLGKTPQALAVLAAATSLQKSGRPHLVVVPASLLENWRREAARFAPRLRVFRHHGAQRLAAERFGEFDIILTSYGTLARDAALFGSIEFDLIVADEAQHLKNRRTQAAQSLRALRGRGRFLLTGTPLENSLDDLRSLFEFLMPGFLPRLPPGLKREEKAFHDDRLRAQTAPYILRRTKTVVAPELPPKIEQVVWCEPDDAQAALYRRLQEDSERELIDLAAAGASENRLRLATLTQLLRLRQACVDPRLVPGADGATGSAKLEAFRELLAESVDEGHRMLVFSQFTSLLGLLRTELDDQQVPYCHLDGSMSPKARQAEVDRFQSDQTIPVFLISLKAGGTGLNLTAADVVVHYDPWWNPAAEAQATDRTHRIGQTKVVTSYRLICAGTVEEKVMALQDEKRALLADVFEASDAHSARLDLADLRELLR